MLYGECNTMIITYTIPKFPPERFETESDAIIIGRRPDEDQRVDLELEKDEYVSRVHSIISRKKDRYWVQDLGSVNGTWVNGKEITEKTLLSPGSTIQIGYTTITVHMDVQPAVEPPSPDIGEDQKVVNETGDAPPVPAEKSLGDNEASEAPAGKPLEDDSALDVPFQQPLSDHDDATVINQDLSPPSEPEPAGEIIDVTDVTIHSLIGSGRDTVDEVLMQGWRQLKAFNDLVQTLGTAEELDALVQILVKHLQGAIPTALRGAVLLPDGGGGTAPESPLAGGGTLGQHDMG